MKKERQKISFYCAAALSIIVILFAIAFSYFLFHAENMQVQKKRSGEQIVRVEEYTQKQIPDEGAPAGVMVEYQFHISDELNRDTSLSFYTVHQYIEVYIGGEQVYSLFPSKEISMVQTVGSNWSIIPLYREDAGKQVRIVLTPVYKNVVNREVEFLIGSDRAIYTARLKKDLPVLFVSALTMLAGILVIILGIFFLHRYRVGWKVVSFGVFSISLGVWRFFDTRFSPFLCPEKPVFLHFFSLFAMMFCVIPFMFSQKTGRKERRIDYYCIGASVVLGGQLIVQILGIADLRQTLMIDHVLIILCILLRGSMMMEKNTIYDGEKIFRRKLIIVCLMMGAAADLLLYYVRKSSSGLLFAMLGLLVFILDTGIGFLDSYIRQEKELIKKEQQIMQIRASSMINQIKSHMVFNILNAISGMCKYDPEKADRTVVCFARYLRANMNLLENDELVPFCRVLEHLEDYLTLEQVRFGEKIRFVKDIQEERFFMPVLILQPLVENAIHHGIKGKPEGGTIVLRTWAEGDMIHITIQDDGVGFDMSQAQKEDSVGIKNVRSRLEYIMQGQLEIESVPGQGTTVAICIARKER